MSTPDWKKGEGTETEYFDDYLLSSRQVGDPYNFTEYGSKTLTLPRRGRKRWYLANSPLHVRQGIPGFRMPTSYRRQVLQYEWNTGEVQWTYGLGDRWNPYVTVKRPNMWNFNNSWYFDDCFDAGNQSADANLHNQAVTECLVKLKGADTASWGPNLAEAVSDVNGLALTAGRFFRTLRDIRNGRVGAYRNLVPAGTSGAYLKWHFGVAPLASDVYSTYKVLQANPFTGMTVKSKKWKSQQIDKQGSTRAFEERTETGKMMAGCGIIATVSDPSLYQASRLGLTNPLSMAWEIVPWSFALDWAMPIGNVLEAIGATAGLSFVSGWTASLCDGKFRGVPYFTESDYGMPVSGSKGYVEIKYTDYQRQVLNGFPTPLPYVKNPFSTSHVATALALWRQLTRGK